MKHEDLNDVDCGYSSIESKCNQLNFMGSGITNTAVIPMIPSAALLPPPAA